VPAVRRTARITGLGIAADIQRSGAAALVGREVKGTQALAALEQETYTSTLDADRAANAAARRGRSTTAKFSIRIASSAIPARRGSSTR